jgi:DNA-directed RNA polymerase III subunit RPC6
MDGLTPSERTVFDFIARAGPDGTLHSVMKQRLVGENSMDTEDIQSSIRLLMESGKIAVVRATSIGDRVDHVLTVKRAPVSENFSLVLSVVRAAGASGIDQNGIQARTKVPKADITKALNGYIQQQAIRETRCFTNKAKKLYIAAEFEPSNEVTGGTFYTETRDLDTQLIDLARQRITNYVKSVGSSNVLRLKNMLDSDSRIAQRRMALREVGIVARTLHLDGVLKRARAVAGDSDAHDLGGRTYTLARERPDVSSLGARANRMGTDHDAWAALYPCTSCPQLNVCQKNGVITPLTCAYLRDWLTVEADRKTSGASATLADAAAAPVGAGSGSAAFLRASTGPMTQPARPQPRLEQEELLV